ncbi:hypothetical protein [Flavobacterium sp.]|uniref:hypothetical protein n=1 Tax=Flavobacterium sp. TaxID=239 RepID=UPI003D12DAF8
MNSNTFYSKRLPEMATILKEKLVKESNKNQLLTVKDYLNSFFEFYEENNAFIYFKDDDIKKDNIIISIFINHVSKEVTFSRKIGIEDCDEEFQINYQLFLDLPSAKNNIVYSFEIERDRFDDFSNSERGYLYLSDFKEIILSSEEIMSIVNAIPQRSNMILNADF